MKIFLISTSFNGLTQRFYTELNDAGYNVAVELHHGDHQQVIKQTELFNPDLIICPFLTRRVPSEVWEKYLTIIVHPGIKGDRGPSSLDWAIQEGFDEWGVTLLQADNEMDAGNIWSSKTFKMRDGTKSSIYNREVTYAAVKCLWEVLAFVESNQFTPEALDYNKPEIKGRLQPQMTQPLRSIDWQKESTNTIIKKIHAADGNPGVIDEIYGQKLSLHNVCIEPTLRGEPGDIIAQSPTGAICRATTDGAVWIGHVKLRHENASHGIKLPCTMALSEQIDSSLPLLPIDYKKEGKSLSCQETWYEVDGDIVYVHGAFHNGAMSTKQCHNFLEVYRHAASLPVRAIVIKGGEDSWSNGIHLNHIEAAENPANESWRNINAINDIVYQIINTMDKVTISAVTGNAGAGGAILALASDLVFARKGVIFNPHYKNMGDLYGSEYWTYLLPNRVGKKIAQQLTSECLPISCRKAWEIGMVDTVLDEQHTLFHAQVSHLVKSTLMDQTACSDILKKKANKRCFNESEKALASYRRHELTQMHHNFYVDEKYHQARSRFVHKVSCGKTQENISISALLPRLEECAISKAV